jgi:hypothetical protein
MASSLVALVSTGLILEGMAILGSYALLRGEDGFYTSSTERLGTSTYALTAENLEIGDVSRAPASWVVGELAGRVRIRAAAPAGSVFVGIAPRRELDRWLSGVAHEQVMDVLLEPFVYDSVRRRGARRPAVRPTRTSGPPP